MMKWARERGRRDKLDTSRMTGELIKVDLNLYFDVHVEKPRNSLLGEYLMRLWSACKGFGLETRHKKCVLSLI
jgi:hypothetical protein